MKKPACRWYLCDVGSKPCQVMRKVPRLFCRECSLVGQQITHPPEEPETNLDLGLWPGPPPQGPAAGAEEVTMKKEESPAAESGHSEETIGQVIARLRDEKGLSANALGKAIGVSGFSVRRWEQGQGEPHFQSATALDDFFGSDLALRFGPQLRGAPISRFIPKAGNKAEQADSQAVEKIDTEDCSHLPGPAAAEQNVTAVHKGRPKPPPAQRPEDQVIEVLSKSADTLLLLAMGLSQVINTLRDLKENRLPEVAK